MIKWQARQLPNGMWEGMITMTPTKSIGPAYGAPRAFPAGKPMRLVARGRSKASALAKAASVANRIANNPILSAALPPGSTQAIKAVNFLATNAAAGKLKKAAAKVVGKGAKRLAKALKFW